VAQERVDASKTIVPAKQAPKARERVQGRAGQNADNERIVTQRRAKKQEKAILGSDI